MKTADVLAELEALSNDCRLGFSDSKYWDKHTWEAMEQIVYNAIEHIQDQEKRIINYSWETNPDRMGQ